ncbi:unnamed protein product, partial [Scytosiphon promiscuus]
WETGGGRVCLASLRLLWYGIRETRHWPAGSRSSSSSGQLPQHRQQLDGNGNRGGALQQQHQRTYRSISGATTARALELPRHQQERSCSRVSATVEACSSRTHGVHRYHTGGARGAFEQSSGREAETPTSSASASIRATVSVASKIDTNPCGDCRLQQQESASPDARSRTVPSPDAVKKTTSTEGVGRERTIDSIKNLGSFEAEHAKPYKT